MRAVVFDGAVKFVDRHPDPTPGDGEAVVRVHLAGLCATDLQIARGYMGFRGVLGHEMVGTVVEGSESWIGRRVAAEINTPCRSCDLCQSGLSNHCRHRTVMGIDGRDGCFADLVAVPEDNLHALPDVVSDEEAVFIEPLAAAYQVIQQCPIESRMRVVVLGSGRLGLLVAQVLATTGCELRVVGRNSDTLSACEKKGIQAEHVEQFVPRADCDVVVECTGSPEGVGLAIPMIRPRGTLVLKSTCAEAGTVNLAPVVVNEIRVVGSRCGPFPEAIDALARKVIDVRSMIARVLPIDRALEAFAAAQQPGTLKVMLKINPA